jgi:hypothetical protein
MSLVPTQTPFFDPKQEAEVKRRRRMAQAMQKAGEQPASTEMVSGMAVKQSPLAGLARMGSAIMGGYQDSKADTAEADIAKRRQEMMAKAIETARQNPDAAAAILAQDPSTSDAAISMVNAGIADERAMRRQQALIDAAFPQRQQELALGQQRLEAGQFELGQARRSQQMQDEILQQMQMQMQPQAQPGGGVLRPDIQELNNQMQGMSGASAATTQDAPASPEQMRMAIARMAVVNPPAANAMRAAMIPSTGGATGMIADRLIEQGVDPLQALLIAKSGLGSGNTMQGGQVQPMQGMTDTLQARNAAEAIGTAVGEEHGHAQSSLQYLDANMPKLEDLVSNLDVLAGKATSTYVGQAVDFANRQLGMEPREAATARAEYVATIDNNILPLLRQTFGAQFTQKEGESLKATLGNVNASPGERRAVLQAFIQQKRAEVEALQRQVGMAAAPQNVQQFQEGTIADGPNGQVVVFTNGRWVPQ